MMIASVRVGSNLLKRSRIAMFHDAQKCGNCIHGDSLPFTQSVSKDSDVATKPKSLFAILSTPEQAERVVNSLIEDGFRSRDVSVLMPDQQSTREFAHHKETKAPEGATAGATAGGVVGGTLGVLIALGALAIPGVGPLLAAGPIVAGLAGVGAGGAVGGLIGALVGMGIPEYEARRYEGRVKDGGILISVHCETPGEILRAREILAGAGATDIASSTESAGAREVPTDRVETRA
jgi:hypothetical protein